MIRLDGVHKQFDGKTVLHDITLHIAPGSFTAVIGGSGSGKTTLLRLMNGLIAPNAGRITVRGQDLAACDLVQLRRSIGYVIQEAGLFPHITVRANMAYVPSLLRWPADNVHRRIDELIDMVRLEPALLERYPHQLSGGQRQRVGIARALAARPDVVLMDEPFGAVDEITRHALQDEIRHIQQRTGSTIVFVTHDIDEAFLLGDQVVVLRDHAEIAQQGTPREILEHPADEFVEQLCKITCR